MAVQWNKNGNWLLTGSRDHLIKMYDIRMMREMHTYRGHKKEVTGYFQLPLFNSYFIDLNILGISTCFIMLLYLNS